MDIALANLTRDGYVSFAIMLVGKDRTITPVLVQARSSSDRAASGDMLRILAPHLDAVVIVSEAWTLKPEDVDEASVTMPVSENPKRIEGVFVTAQSVHGELMLTKTFERDSARKPIVEGEVTSTWKELSIMATGNFCNLFGDNQQAVQVPDDIAWPL